MCHTPWWVSIKQRPPPKKKIGQFQRWPRSQGHSIILISEGKSQHKKCSRAIWNSNSYYLEERTNVNLIFFKVKLQGQCHRVNYNGIYGKAFFQGILKWKIKAIALTVQKLWARLNFSKNRSNSKVKVTGSKIMVPAERP